MRVELPLQSRLRGETDDAFDDLATLEEHQRRDRHDPVALGDRRNVVDIELGNGDLLAPLPGEGVDDGRHLAAGTAPDGPEVDEDGLGVLQDGGVEVRLREFEGVSSHWASFLVKGGAAALTPDGMVGCPR